MLSLMEKKIPWNLRVFESVANGFDEQVDRAHRGDKGMSVNAAVLMFLVADDQTRQRYVDVVKLAEGRGLDGSVLEAASKILSGSAEDEALSTARDHHKQAQPAGRSRRGKKTGT